jgi:hypothetical protein
MRHVLLKFVAAVFVVGLALGMSQAQATPRPTLNGLASQAGPVEKAHYYGYRHYGYRVTTIGVPITGPTITAMAIGRIGTTVTGIGPTTIAVTGSRQA